MQGREGIRSAAVGLIGVPGTMHATNNCCLQKDDLALLRADWAFTTPDGQVLAHGSSAELIRQQADGRWLYVIDHAVVSSIARADGLAGQ